MSTSVSVDFVTTFPVSGSASSSQQDKFMLREAELTFYAPVDHLFDGILSLAAHNEDGKLFFEIHEATLSSAKLITNSELKLGQFFLGIGRLNQIHQHDWLFTSAPKVHKEFFGSEGVLDTGLEYSFLFPSDFYFNITAGISSGWVFGHSHNAGFKPKVPTHYLRVSSYHDIFDSLGLEFGLNYLSRKDSEQTLMRLFGVDFISKLSSSSFSQFLTQAEFWFKTEKKIDQAEEATMGAYLYTQYGISSEWFTGLRFDYFSKRSLKTAGGADIDHAEYALVPNLVFHSSEFTTFKMSYHYLIESQSYKKNTHSSYFECQATYILGAHPSHAY